MNLLYAHDHKLKINKGSFFSTGGFSDEVTLRYTKVFGHMELLCRAIESEDLKGCQEILNPDVTIYPFLKQKIMPTYVNLKYIIERVNKSEVIMVRLPSLLGIYTALCGFRLNKIVCVEVVGSALGSYWYKGILGKVLAHPLEFLNKTIIQKANYVLYVSEDYLQKEYPTSGIMLGCSDVVLQPRTLELLERRLNKINENNSDTLVLGTLGQVDYKYKGHETVIKVMSKLKKSGRKVEYHLAGSGNPSRLIKIAKKYDVLDEIKFLGQIRHDVVIKWIDEIDLYIQPSLTEGMPRSVIEALYRGCPVITSDAGGMYELVEEKYIFKKGNKHDLFKILNDINNEKMYDMAQRNYYFADKFNYENLKKREDFYLKIRDEVNYELV